MRSTSAQHATATNTFKSAQSSRFSLLALEDGEFFLDDFGAIRYLEPALDTHRKVQGRLKVCTRSLFFVPHDAQLPMLRFPFRAMTTEPRAECFAFVDDARMTTAERQQFVAAAVANVYVAVETTNVIEMKTRGVDHPYITRQTGPNSTSNDTEGAVPTKYIFTLLYSRLDKLLASIHMVFGIATRRRRDRIDEQQLLASVLAPRQARAFDTSLLVDFREKLLMDEPALVDRIEPLVKYPGCLMLTTARVYFQPAKLNNVHAAPVLQWEYTAITQLYKRRYLLRQIGLELVVANGATVFFACASRRARDALYAMLVAQPALALCCREDLTHMLLQWQRREVTNFDYLAFLNSAAGRTRNDLTQYPVFPWVLRDYTSATLDLTNPETFRDLSKPIGALNADRLAAFRARFDAMPRSDEVDDNGSDGLPPPFLYGTHYSTPGYVLYYLVRLAPQHMLCLQNGKFDAPDRLFRSVARTWHGCVTNAADLKELIPEFYDDVDVTPADWLCNKYDLALGTTQSQHRVDDVELPPWADGDPRTFVRTNRAALESEYVSAHIHDWIDLIFGYKQQGDEAIKANNLFYYLSYEGAIDLETVTDAVTKRSLEMQIQEFGQTPTQLFATPHPTRDAVESKIEVATPELLPSPRGGLQTQTQTQLLHLRQRRLTYPPPSALLRSRRGRSDGGSRGRKTLAMSSFAYTHDGSDDDSDNNDSDTATSNNWTTRRSIAAARRSLESGLSFLCIQAPRETVPRALQLSSQLWHTLGSAGSAKPLKHWHWHDRMSLASTADTEGDKDSVMPQWRWTQTRAYAAHHSEITSAVLARDGATLFTTGKDRQLVVSRVTDGRVCWTLASAFALSCCELSVDNRLLFVGRWDNCVALHSMRTGRELDRVVAHADGVSAIVALPSARFLTSSWDATVKLWRYTPVMIIAVPVGTFHGATESVLCLDASTNGAFAAAGTRNGRVYVLGLTGPTAPALHCDVCVSPQQRGDVAAIAFAADGNSVVCMTVANELLQLSLSGEQVVAIDMQAPGIVRCLASDGAFAVGGTTNGRLFFWRLHDAPRGRECVLAISGAHATIVSALAVSVDGATVVSGAIDGSVHVWQLLADSVDDRVDSMADSVDGLKAAAAVGSECDDALACKASAVRAAAALPSTSTRDDLDKHVTTAKRRHREEPLDDGITWQRDASALFTPLSHLYRADLSFTMEESHFFFEAP